MDPTAPAYKIVALIPRRPDLTPERFRAIYEGEHAPLFHRTLPDHVADDPDHFAQPADSQ